MITEELYKEISSNWKEPIYQSKERLFKSFRLQNFVETCVPSFKDKDVLEFGCNAGIFGYELSQVAKSYIGVDIGACYTDQAKITMGYVKIPNKIYTCDINKFLEKNENFNALVMCYTLYHFTDREIMKLITYVLPKCDVVCIQNRHKKKPKDHNSYKLYKHENVIELLKKHGLTNIATSDGYKKKYMNIIATK